MSGWGAIINRRKWHYFDEKGNALCDRAIFLDKHENLEQGNDSSPDNCVECKRKKTKLKL